MIGIQNSFGVCVANSSTISHDKIPKFSPNVRHFQTRTIFFSIFFPKRSDASRAVFTYFPNCFRIKLIGQKNKAPQVLHAYPVLRLFSVFNHKQLHYINIRLIKYFQIPYNFNLIYRNQWPRNTRQNKKAHLAGVNYIDMH